MLSELRELFRFRELLYNLVARDLKARYKHSFLGFLWSLANPLIQIATFTVVFRYIIRLDIPNFSAFFSVAFIPWTFLQTAVMDASAAVLLNARIMKRVYFPREILPMTQVTANLVHFSLAMAVLFGYLLYVGVHFDVRQLAYLPLVILLQVVLLSGLALAVSCVSIYFEDIRFLVAAGLNILYYGSCIFYPVKFLENAGFGWVAWANPVVPMVKLYRQTVLHGTGLPDTGPVDLRLLLVVGLWAVVSFVVGYALFNARKWEFAERI